MFRFTIFREEIILIIEESERIGFTVIQEDAPGGTAARRVGRALTVEQDTRRLATSPLHEISEVQILLVVTRRQRPAHAWRAPGSLDRPTQDQQGLIQTAIVEGRCLAEGLGYESLGQLEFIQN